MQNKIVIIGSGLVGSLWAYMLHKRGYDVEVFEKRSDPKNLKSPAGRSINLVITSRGLYGLKIAGLLEKILPITVPIYGREIHPKIGDNLFQPYGRDKSECNYSVSRWDLNKALIQACQEAGIKIHFDHEVTGIDIDKKELCFTTEQGPGPSQVKKNYTQVFATDGAGSVIRKSLIAQLPQEFSEQVDWLDSDYKEVHMPSKNQQPVMEKNALHIWPRGTHMMMGLANADNSFTMTLYLPKQSHPYAFENLQNKSEVEAMFTSEFSDAVKFMPDYGGEFLQNPQGKLATVRLNRWFYGDSVAFLGDAAHAIVPFFGQRMNLGFEDCTTLLRLLEENGHHWGPALERYDAIQRPNANAIADMALENFVEMRDKVGDAKFQFKKKVEGLIEKEFPQHYRSRYGLITYTLTPYVLAQEAGKKQNEMLEQISADLARPEDLDLVKVKEILEKTFIPWSASQNIQTESFRP